MAGDEGGNDRLSRRLRISIEVGIVAVIAIAIATVGFIEYSAQPSFCLNCHIMEPYYESWESSSHNDVKCIACHYAPGIKAEAMGKLQAANQVVKYVTGAYGLRPWAEIDDAACLRSGCHTERMLEGEVDFLGVNFDHAGHLGELRAGKRLRCTSCHSQIVQGDHIAVTQTTCYLCHFKSEAAASGVAACTGCHPSPPTISSTSGTVVDHPQYVRDLISCTSCHDQVIVGDGHADRSRCSSCHAEESRLRAFDDTERLHRVHITERKVECTQCHTPIDHRLPDFAPVTVELECSACHRGAHEVQKRLYSGFGGHATDSMPSVMYAARVSCLGCHELLREIPGHGQVRAAGEASCLSCHGIRYANILPAWQSEIDRRVDLVAPVVRRAREVLPSASSVRERRTADSLLQLAQENVDFVRLGKGAHNITYSDRLLRSALSLVDRAVYTASLAYAVPDVDLGPVVDESACLSCHLGVESREAPYLGRTFDHEVHVRGAALSCDRCHTPMEDHGGITVTSVAACDDCHHPAIGGPSCAACHEGEAGAPRRTLALPGGDFSHQVHGPESGLACETCHSGALRSAAETRCEGCHEAHHVPARECIACHREGAVDSHEVTEHIACVECHDVPGIDRWSRQVCLACHADYVEHNAPEPCTQCHRVPAMSPAGGTGDGPEAGPRSLRH